MAKVDIVDIAGKQVGEHDIANVEVGENAGHLVYLLNKYQRAKRRHGNSAVKNRSAVSGGGAKPYRQKGTGNARRGTNRSPLRRGGGVIFGPQPRSYNISLNQQVVRSAVAQAFSGCLSKVAVLKLGDQDLTAKDWRPLLADKKQRVLVVVDGVPESILSLLNFSNVEINTVNALSVEWLCKVDKIYVLESAVESLVERYYG